MSEKLQLFMYKALYFYRIVHPNVRGAHFTREIYNYLFGGHMLHPIRDEMTKSELYLSSKLLCFTLL